MYRLVINLITIALLSFFASMAVAQTANDPASAASGATAEGERSLVDITVRPFGERMLTPIAVPNAIGDGTDAPGALGEIGEIIRRCLLISGYFEVLGPDRVFFDPDAEGVEAANIQFELWGRTGAEALVKTAWRRAEGGFALDFRLYSMAAEGQIDINWERKTVPLAEVRGEVYAFVNAVIEYYSGDRGIFGDRIAFAAPGRGGDKQIYTVSIDGSDVSGVTGGSGIHLFPSWAPGGAIIYTELREHETVIRMTGRESALSDRVGLNMNGVFSPNGSEIAATLSLDGDTDVYILDRNGNIIRQCTEHGGEDLSPAWSPDGSQIAFVSDRSGGPQVFVMNSDCSNQRRVTFRGSYNTGPEWSPRGDVIAFTGRSEGRYDIFTVNPETNYIERLTQDQGSNMDPTWSRDGRYIAFVSTRGGRGGSLYISTADGQIQTLVSDRLSGIDTPAWQR